MVKIGARARPGFRGRGGAKRTCGGAAGVHGKEKFFTSATAREWTNSFSLDFMSFQYEAINKSGPCRS